MAKLKITPIRNFQHVGAEGKEGLRAGVSVELAEADAKSYVAAGWAILTESEAKEAKEEVKVAETTESEAKEESKAKK